MSPTSLRVLNAATTQTISGFHDGWILNPRLYVWTLLRLGCLSGLYTAGFHEWASLSVLEGVRMRQGFAKSHRRGAAAPEAYCFFRERVRSLGSVTIQRTPAPNSSVSGTRSISIL